MDSVHVIKAEDGMIHAILSRYIDARATMSITWHGVGKCIFKPVDADGFPVSDATHPDQVQVLAPDGSCWTIEKHIIRNKSTHL